MAHGAVTEQALLSLPADETKLRDGGVGRDLLEVDFDRGTGHVHEEIEEIYRGSDFAAKAIDTLPFEMLRAGYDLLIEGDKKVAEACNARAEDMLSP